MSGDTVHDGMLAWASPYTEGLPLLVSVGPPKQLEVNGAPVTEISHEFVVTTNFSPPVRRDG